MTNGDRREAGARLSLDMVGSASDEQMVAWSERETLLYAIGVGAGLGAPDRELSFTTENSRGFRLQALPSFLTILIVGNVPPAMKTIDVGRLLHAEQQIEIERSLPPSGRGLLRTSIQSVLDKGAGAIITTVSTFHEDSPNRPLIGRGRMSIFVRGAGGFGGTRGTPPATEPPARAADLRIVHQTRPEQALLYRLSGDRHPLHSDPAFARERGFDGPILQGLCTYGFACRALIEGAGGGDAVRLRGMSGRFRKPVYPGETLVTEIWTDGTERVQFRTLDSAGDAVIERGTATIAI